MLDRNRGSIRGAARVTEKTKSKPALPPSENSCRTRMLPRLRSSIVDGEREPFLPSEHSLVFRAVILKHRVDVFQQRKAENHDQEKCNADHSVDQIEPTDGRTG